MSDKNDIPQAIEWIRLYIRSSNKVSRQALEGFAYGAVEVSPAGDGFSVGVKFVDPPSRQWAEEVCSSVRGALEPWLLFEKNLATILLPDASYECRLKGSKSTEVCAQNSFRYASLPRNAVTRPSNLSVEQCETLSQEIQNDSFLRLAKAYLWEGEVALQEGRRDYVDVATLYFAKSAEVLSAHPRAVPNAEKFKDKLVGLNRLTALGLSNDALTQVVRSRNRVAHARVSPQPTDYFTSAFDLRNLVRQALLKLAGAI